MFAASGLLALQGLAVADVGAAQVSRILTPDPNDLAPTTGNPARLRRTDEEQPGKEMMHIAMLGDNKSGFAVMMSSGALPNGQTPVDREQCAIIPFQLMQNPDGSVTTAADVTKAKYFTTNKGNEYRNCNHPALTTINNGNAVLVEYNYQPNNGNDTKRYAMVFDKAGNVIMPQTQIFAKNNDDAAMTQDNGGSTVATSVGGKNHIVAWEGANGNGRDDGWLLSYNINCDSETAPTQCTYQKEFDISLCQREERSHGLCTVGTDPNTAICTWTEGNTQPQRDGVWVAAVDITPGAHSGADQQGALIWKQQVDGRHGQNGTRTYSMRMMHERILTPDTMAPTDDIIVRYGAVQGDNNNNNGKGGTYYGNMMGVATVTKAGLTWKLKPVDMQAQLLGLDGTHLGMVPAFYGTTDKLQPGVMFIAGSHTGGGYAGKVRAVSFDTTANTFKDLGAYSIASYDRHLYPNYLGNNPGNQGRNYSGAILVKNPYLGVNGSKDAYLIVTSTTGKDTSDIMQPAIKLSAYLTVMPVAQIPTSADPPPPAGSGSGSNPGSGSDPAPGSGSNPNPDPGASDPGSTLGGCSAGGSSGGAATLFLIGLAAFIRRRR